MEIQLKVALISAGAVILAALIGLIGKKLQSNRNTTTIKQKAKGNNAIQIGLQKNYLRKEEDRKIGKHEKPTKR